MRTAFAIRAWSAIAPGLFCPDDWHGWLEHANCPCGDLEVDLPHVPAMARRRLGLLAKMAVSVADTVLTETQCSEAPVVWASRYGDAEKSLTLLQTQAQNEPLSPTAFGLSVHNGIGAQHSILRGMRSNAVCVASSRCAPEAGVMEALGLLTEGAPEVLLVCYDAPLASGYDVFHDEPAAAFAWAALLVPHQGMNNGFSLQPIQSMAHADGSAEPEAFDALPHGLNVLHFLLQSRRDRLERRHATGRWLWERLHA